MVTVRRELDADDYRAFAAYVSRTAGGPSLFLALGIFAALLTAAFAAVEVCGWDWHIPTSMATILAVVGGFVIAVLMHARAIAPDPEGLLMEPSELTVSDDGLVDRGDRAESVFRWPAVRRVAVTDRHVFIMFDRVQGLIVPRDSFADEAAEDEFLREVRRRCPDTVEWSDR